MNISFWFSSCCGGLPLFSCLAAMIARRIFCHDAAQKMWTYTQPSKSLKRFSFSLPPLFTARRKAIEGKRKVKTEEEELAGNEFFLSFLLSGARPSFFYGLRIPIIQPFYSVLTSIYNHSGAKSEWAASIRRARIVIRKMCKMQWWFWTVILMVFLNTCTVAVEHYNQPQWLTEFLCK